MRCIVFFATLFTLSGAYLEGNAQDSLVAHADNRGFVLPGQPSLAAGESVLCLYQRLQVSRVGIDYRSEQGRLRRPQDPSSITVGTFRASGFQQTTAMLVFGEFQYSLQRDEGQHWRNTGHDADVQPFIWADTSQGIWDRNHFDARVTMASDWKGRRLQAGVSVQYGGGTGDRRTTPKPLYRVHQLTAEPSLIYNVKGHRLAATVRYRQQSEDNEMGYYVVDSPLLYRLRGYGTFSRTPFVSGDRLLKATTWGGQVDYLKGSLIKSYTLAILTYEITTGTITEGVATPISAGEWTKNTLRGKVGMGKAVSTGQWQIGADIAFSDLSATDPVFQAINYYLRLLDLKPTVRYERANRWYLQLDGAYRTRSQRDIVSLTDAVIDRTAVSLTFNKRFMLTDGITLFGAPGTGYVKAMNSDLQILTPTEISNKLVRPDFEILTQSYAQAGIAAGIDVTHHKDIIRLTFSVNQLRNDLYNRTQIDASLQYLLF